MKPFPWTCTSCGQQQIYGDTIDYVARTKIDGDIHTTYVPNLPVGKCHNCGSVVFHALTTEFKRLSMKHFNLTITLPVWIDNLPADANDVAHALTRDNWSDGRYSFHIEMLHRGLEEEIKSAIENVVNNHMISQYGKEMVPTGPGRETARWYLEAEKLLQAVSVGVRTHVTEATLEEA